MKKCFAPLLLCTMLLCLCSCGNIRSAETAPYDSQLYTHQEIEDAIDAAKDYFRRGFSGCTLTQITYAGDETTVAHEEWAQRHDADQVLVLTSTFEVDSSGGNGSLNPNSTYTNWMWIMVRKTGGSWQHADHGY